MSEDKPQKKKKNFSLGQIFFPPRLVEVGVLGKPETRTHKLVETFKIK